MRYFRALILGLCCLSMLVAATRHPAVTTAQTPAQPLLAMSGLQLADQVRYSLTLGNTLGTALNNLQVQIQLPGDAMFVQGLETPGFTQFQGNQNGTLAWSALSSLGPSDAIDPFAFSLQQPATGSFGVHATWSGDNPGQLDTTLQPPVTSASATSGQLVLTADMLNGSFVPVGDTGVQVASVDSSVPAGTTITVKLLGPDSNPPGGTGDLWWCTMVEIDGLPVGASLQVSVPTRQPLAPGAAVSLFTQSGGAWSQTDQQGYVTADGQAISFLDRGGTVAAGTSPSFQLSGATTNPTLIHQGTIARVAAAINQLQILGQMVSGAKCGQPGVNCRSLQTCGPQGSQIQTTFPTASATATTMCANAGFDGSTGIVGNSQCFLDQSSPQTIQQRKIGTCIGWVPELLGSRTFVASGGTGLGTRCTYPSPNTLTGVGVGCFDSVGPP